MIFRKEMFNKVAILGVGLIGGSMGLALKKRGLARKVVGVTSTEESIRQAKAMGAIDEGTHDVKVAVSGADFVILAAPVHVIISHLDTINKVLKRNALVTDVGSSKLAIVNKAQDVLGSSALFVGSHPMAGSEKRGVESAYEGLFEQSMCIMTPTDLTNKVAIEKVKHIWEELGAQVHLMLPSEHDEALAYISHLPHVIAYALMSSIPEPFLKFGSTGLKDTTRIASSSPKMWNDICLSNQRNVLKSMDQFIENMAKIRQNLLDKDEHLLTDQFTKAKQKRDSIN